MVLVEGSFSLLESRHMLTVRWNFTQYGCVGVCGNEESVCMYNVHVQLLQASSSKLSSPKAVTSMVLVYSQEVVLAYNVIP